MRCPIAGHWRKTADRLLEVAIAPSSHPRQNLQNSVQVYNLDQQNCHQRTLYMSTLEWIDPHLYRWLSRHTSVRSLAVELGISRSHLHKQLVERAEELGVNSQAGRGDGLWAVISQEYLDPKKLAKMREKDRAEIEEWTRANFQKILSSTESRVYTSAECKNRTRRDVVGKDDLAIMEMEGANIGKWFGAKLDQEFDLPECTPIKIRKFAIPIPAPKMPICKRVPAPTIAPLIKRTIAASSPDLFKYAAIDQPRITSAVRAVHFQPNEFAAAS